MKDPVKALIWNIQRFNINDGNGIRTLVFFKGCPLTCLWCSNPEGQSTLPELQFLHYKCIKCNLCKDACPNSAISINEGFPHINNKYCNTCGRCEDNCPSGALKVLGKYLSVKEVMEEIRKDTAFYRKSDGGITLSGGEPCLQADFVRELLIEAQNLYINTTIETCGHVPWKTYQSIVENTDTFLFDIKNMDSHDHKEQTGVSNELILSNAKMLSVISDVELIFRTPIIPGKNDSRKNLIATAEFAAELGVKRWDIMAYHRLGEAKYNQLCMEYPLKNIQTPTDERMDEIVALVKPIFPNITIENR